MPRSSIHARTERAFGKLVDLGHAGQFRDVQRPCTHTDELSGELVAAIGLFAKDLTDDITRYEIYGRIMAEHELTEKMVLSVTGHGELELPGGVFIQIALPRKVVTYGLGMSVLSLMRDPMNASGFARLG